RRQVYRQRSSSRSRSFAPPAMERAQKPERARRPARLAAGAGSWAISRGSFRSRAHAPRARARGKWSRGVFRNGGGQGRLEKEKTIELRVPAGVDTGTRLRVPGEGEPGANGGPTGDLYVVLEVKEHSFFERRGADLYCTIPVSIAQAALGAELTVP